MNVLQLSPAAGPVDWILTILGLSKSGFAENVFSAPHSDVRSILLILCISQNEQHVMSAIISAVYVLNHNLDNNHVLQDGIENLPPCRWDELLRMSPIVARESIRLLEYLPIYPPMLLCYHGAYIAHDPMLVNPLAQIWIEKRWEVSIDFVYSIHSSYHGWKLLHRFNTGNCTSQQIFQNIVDTSIPGDCLTLANHCALLGVNGSALEYLMYLDAIHGDGIASTINTIDRYALRDIGVDNPTASPIIDYILDADDAAREWLIPLICENEIASKCITVEDMKGGLVEDEFFSNPYAIDILEKWIADSDISHNYVIGLVDIASSYDRDAAKKAMEILDRHQTVYGKHIAVGFSDKLVSKMLLSPHAKSFIIKNLKILGGSQS